MKLWLLTQDKERGYDTFDSCVVAAETEAEAQRIHPSHDPDWSDHNPWGTEWPCWAHTPEQVTTKLIGEAIEGTPAGVILASYNAG